MKQRIALVDRSGDLVDVIAATRPWPGSVVHLGRVFCRDEDGASMEAVLHDEMPLMVYREEPDEW